MGDMLREAYGDEYPNYYTNSFGEQEVREGTMIEYEHDFPTVQGWECDMHDTDKQKMKREFSVAFTFDNFPSPDELRRRNLELNLSDYYVLDEIETLLKTTEDDQYAILYEGFIGHNVTRFLLAKGYKVCYVHNEAHGDCTRISWGR